MKITVWVNGRKHAWSKATISYDDIVGLATSRVVIRWMPTHSITMQIGAWSGVLLPGKYVTAVDDTTFQAHITSNG